MYMSASCSSLFGRIRNAHGCNWLSCNILSHSSAIEFSLQWNILQVFVIYIPTGVNLITLYRYTVAGSGASTTPRFATARPERRARTGIFKPDHVNCYTDRFQTLFFPTLVAMPHQIKLHPTSAVSSKKGSRRPSATALLSRPWTAKATKVRAVCRTGATGKTRAPTGPQELGNVKWRRSTRREAARKQRTGRRTNLPVLPWTLEETTRPLSAHMAPARPMSLTDKLWNMWTRHMASELQYVLEILKGIFKSIAPAAKKRHTDSCNCHTNRCHAQAWCKFWRLQFPKLLRARQFLTILTSKSLSRAGVVQILATSWAADPPQLPFLGADFPRQRSHKTTEKHSVWHNSYPPNPHVWHLCCITSARSHLLVDTSSAATLSIVGS